MKQEGLVIKSTGSRYRVLYGDLRVAECAIKGKFRVRGGLKTTNPVAVGDRVLFEFEPGTAAGIITDLLDRKNYILRRASNLSKQVQILAANVDHVFLMVTISHPLTQPEFIDRFLISAEAYRIPAGLIINKTDLYTAGDTEKMEHMISVYEKIGYKCYRLSVREQIGLEPLIDCLKGKISLIAGNSGVGKTTLLNTLNPELNLKTAKISDYHKQGKHITTFPEMHSLPFGGYLIDSPGIKGFGMVDMQRNEIYHFFPEIFRISENCKFYNCLHLDEPGCAVRLAVEEGDIDPLRYRSYLNIIEDENRKYR
ncbi:MAG TPA: ribosome small subunit-dependent GTPase A [Bacteroidales bacterium]|nr:ribosome small subunit-dependent GTPase A [Bacteroidales bacterium]HQH23141.1 ribosome small subunit-dependent GTPase A [Bacteroidales bacterium]HQJ81001.1 ribosome small subunit-dependent GTPase A [Bacteroidales bacterium]